MSMIKDTGDGQTILPQKDGFDRGVVLHFLIHAGI
jgi:hypothetical protein